jgi:hypothetical protein
MGNFKEVREMVEEIKSKNVSIDKNWRMLLEGALFEGR